MKPFDDSIPAEKEARDVELLSMLRRAYPGPVQLTFSEQEQIIERARKRLLLNDQGVTASEDRAVQSSGVINSTPQRPLALPTRRRQRVRIARAASWLAAVLVVAVIVGASLLLFQNRKTTVSNPANLPDNMVTVRSEIGGIEMSMSLTPGPYFLSEMLAVDITLSNQTRNTLYVGIPFVLSGCGYTTGVQVSGGGTPAFVVPIATDHLCPGGFNNTTPVKAGQTLTVQRYMPIENTGKLTLTAETAFYQRNSNGQNPVVTRVSNQLEDHWPSLQINVASVIPTDRKFSFQRDGPRIIVHAPTDAQHSLLLLYLYGVSCQDYNDQGGTESGNYGWEVLHSNSVGEPGCPGKNLRWAYAFAVPGYAVTSGSAIFPGKAANP